MCPEQAPLHIRHQNPECLTTLVIVIAKYLQRLLEARALLCWTREGYPGPKSAAKDILALTLPESDVSYIIGWNDEAHSYLLAATHVMHWISEEPLTALPLVGWYFEYETVNNSPLYFEHEAENKLTARCIVCRCITRFWIFVTPLLLDPNFRVGKKMGWLKRIRKKIKDGVQQLLIVSDSSDSKDEPESDSIQFHISISNKVKISEGVIPSPSTESNSSVLGKGNHAGEQSSSQESTVQVPVLDNKGKTIAFRELSPVYENTSEEQLKSSAQSYKQVPVYKKGKIISYHQVSSSPKEPVKLGLSQVPIQNGNDTQQTSRNKKVPVIDNNGIYFSTRFEI
ncbi:hypothetical protein K435DRAFT_887317 [Dendrothele bispora CBS 962.96]|uniref:Uncharacterized protein n=1 Tax=Dendrothele bispora (strain CBS 962.96) TaxID=1314807 RepID=A0A4S8KT24_DENBC|nr:hypothetical protein K435DRAFT_887317 [Dendrothele bispora CBS 962.96]